MWGALLFIDWILLKVSIDFCDVLPLVSAIHFITADDRALLRVYACNIITLLIQGRDGQLNTSKIPLFS